MYGTAYPRREFLKIMTSQLTLSNDLEKWVTVWLNL
jgi:hypothetical protein